METHQNGLGDGIAPARDAVPAVPNLGLPTPAEDDDPAITDMDHAKRLLRDLRKQNRVYERTIDVMANKMDALTSMMNSLMENQAQQKQVPNITGWPPAQELVHSNPPPTSVVNSQPMSGAVAPPLNLQNLVLQPPEQSSTQAANWGAVHSPRLPATSPSVPGVPIATLAAPPPGVPPAAPPQFQYVVAPPVAQTQIPYATAPPAAHPQVQNLNAPLVGNLQQPRVPTGITAQAPRGDAVDSDDEEEYGSAAQAYPPPRRRGRGRGPRGGLVRQQARHTGSEEEDNPNDDYALNRERPETHCKSLSIKHFSSDDKSQDFDIWISQFEEAVNRGLNPHSKRRHYNYCLKWLPGYLNSDAYVIWKRAQNRADWDLLKTELAHEFEDPTIRIKWTTNEVAYEWDEHKESLTLYCAKIKRYVDKYDTDIAGVPRAVRNQYYSRFFNGLPDDYQNQVKMGMSSKKRDINRALDICIRYQTLKQKLQNTSKDKKLEVGASVTFQDPTAPSRITQCETNIVRIMKEVDKLKKQPQTNGANYGSYHHNQNHQSGRYNENGQDRMDNRMNRFQSWRSTQSRGNPRGLGARARGSLSRNRYSHPQKEGFRSGVGHQPPKANSDSVPAASLEEGYPLQSELESGAEDLNDTIQQFAALTQEQQEMAFIAFCEEKDQLDQMCVPGNY